MNDYEQERQETIRANEELLLSLGLITPEALAAKRATASTTGFAASYAPPKPKTKPKVVKPKVERPLRTPTRGSARLLERASDVKLKKESTMMRTGRLPMPMKDFIVSDETLDGDREIESSGKGVASGRLYSTKRVGAIPGVAVGSWWPLRAGASLASIHGPLVAGISGNADVGAWSICASGGYEDNQDNGTSFTFTGAGGRDLRGTASQPKNLRTAAQSFHQSFEHPMNAALYKSWKTGKPVRVLRGFKSSSNWAPVEGYRYDGLYTVVDARLVRSNATGYKVCTFQFERLPGQTPIPTREDAGVHDSDPLAFTTPVKPSRPQITPSSSLSSLDMASPKSGSRSSISATPSKVTFDRHSHPASSSSFETDGFQITGYERYRMVEVEILVTMRKKARTTDQIFKKQTAISPKSSQSSFKLKFKTNTKARGKATLKRAKANVVSPPQPPREMTEEFVWVDGIRRRVRKSAPAAGSGRSMRKTGMDILCYSR